TTYGASFAEPHNRISPATCTPHRKTASLTYDLMKTPSSINIMIAPDRCGKRIVIAALQHAIRHHAFVNGFIITPYFGPALAKRNCDLKAVASGSGPLHQFGSSAPQPPELVGPGIRGA